MRSIPSITDITVRVLSNLESGMGVEIPDDRNFLNVNAKVTAAELKLLYLDIALVQKNLFPDTSDSELYGGTLERSGRIFLGRNPYPATAGQYTLTITGTIGAVIPASTTFKSNDDSLSPGYLFILDASYTLVATTDTITVRAVDGGLISRLSVGDDLTCTRPIINVNSAAVVAAETIVPIDAEDIELYRAKVLEKILLVAGSWSATDYRLVGVNVAGVKQIYAYAYTGHSNEVNVWVEGTVPGTATDGAIVTAVETATELVRPLGVFMVNYAACPINSIDVTITEPIPGTITTAQRASILSAMRTKINAIRPFIAACDILANENDYFSNSTLIFWALEAVGSIAISSVSFTVDSVSESEYLADYGNIPYLTSITYA